MGRVEWPTVITSGEALVSGGFDSFLRRGAFVFVMFAPFCHTELAA
jgi:hypothetical protein